MYMCVVPAALGSKRLPVCEAGTAISFKNGEPICCFFAACHVSVADYCATSETPCVASNACQNATCVPRTGVCTVVNLPDGAACNTSAIVNGTCRAAVCTAQGGHAVVDNEVVVKLVCHCSTITIVTATSYVPFSAHP